MAQYDISKTTTTGLDTGMADYLFAVTPVSLDSSQDQEETYWDFPDAQKNLGYYKTIPELKKAVDSLAIWTAGIGYETDSYNKVILEHISGWGEDSFNSIMQNMIIIKKVVSDSFAEIIRDKDGTLINLKPISPERIKIVVGKNGRIKRYEIKGKIENTKFAPENILHLCNDRVGDEIHGVSVVDACKWVIDARNEAMTDYRKVLHRNVVPVRIIEVDTDDVTKRNALIKEYEEAIKKGEVLVIPKGTVEIKDTQINIQDPIAWIQYLENFFYQAVGVPRVIATAQDYTEAGSKVSFLTFEPVYTNEQTLLEQDLWNQLGIKIKFNRPPSLGGVLQQSEAANTGQTNFQPGDMTASVGRE